MCEEFCTVGIDGGGSKTECAIVNSHGEVLGVGRGGTSNMNYAAMEEVRESVDEACRVADEAAGSRKTKVVRIGCAMLRVRRPNQSKAHHHARVAEIERVIEDRFGSEILYLAEGEVALACIDAFDQLGIACVAGTGSSCFGMGQDGKRVVRGGWGSPLGDEGGAYDIAIQGIRAAGKAFEKRAPETTLLELAAEFFGEEFNSWFLRRLGPKVPEMRPEVAKFARIVSKAAEEGDIVAGQILDSAADDLAGLVLCVARALFGSDDEFPVALHGGVFSNNRVAGRTREIVLREFPQARAVQSFHSPGVGAALLARYSVEHGLFRAEHYT